MFRGKAINKNVKCIFKRNLNYSRTYTFLDFLGQFFTLLDATFLCIFQNLFHAFQDSIARWFKSGLVFHAALPYHNYIGKY